MTNYEFSYDGIFDAIGEGSKLAREFNTDFFTGEIELFLDTCWKEYFVSVWDLCPLPPGKELNDWEANLRPGLEIETWEELCEKMGSAFDSWLMNQKTRLNLSVGGDIPYLLANLAGGERMRGEYITQLIREIIQNQTKVKPDIQALRLEVMGLDGRLRTLERQFDDLSRR